MIYRLYRPEWITVHTISAAGTDARPCYDLAAQWAADHLKDIPAGYVRIDMNTDGNIRYWAHIVVFKDNLKGEFTSVSAATTFADIKSYDEYTIVERDSKEDHAIRSSGIAA